VTEYRELLLGCGSRREKLLSHPEHPTFENVTTLDINTEHKPDVCWDLNELPLPFEADSFDEIHAYEVLEHLGRQGDFRFFFAEFEDFWRILKPGGFLFGTSPGTESEWLWGDPGHTRVIQPQSLIFLSQAEYTRQVGNTPMTDYRFCYRGDFDIVHCRPGAVMEFGLKAVKPARI
jgi:SAM-dependent methyltransferase